MIHRVVWLMAVVVLHRAAPMPPVAAADAVPAGPDLCRRPAVQDLKIVNDQWPDPSGVKAFAEDAVRLSGAKTDQEKALAVWQWVRRCTTKLSNPRKGGHINTMRLLNVLGSEWCDGMSLAMQHCWRALGYPARKYYRNGHTYADCWWVDADGVGRWHTFDVNYGWFLFTRDGSRIATGEEIGTDFSLFDHPSRTTVPWIDKHYWMWAWTHARMYQFNQFDTGIALHPGAEIERLWGNVGRPWSERCGPREWADPDPRPYDWTYGNSIQSLTALLGEGRGGGEGWRDQVAAEPVNVAVRDGALVQADAAKPGEVIYCVRTPYPIADVDVHLTPARGTVTLSAAVPGAKTWRVITAIPAGTPADRTVTYRTSGFGRYERPLGRSAHLVRVQLAHGAEVSRLSIDTVVQNNFLVLPTLVPGRNRITVSGALAPGHALEVTTVWDDPIGKGRTHTVRAVRLPYTYTIRAAGRRWRDVRCRSLVARAVRSDATANAIIASPPDPPKGAVHPVQWTDVLTLNGPRSAPPLRTTAEYLKDLDGKDTHTRRLALSGLIVRRDPAAWSALERIAREETTSLRYYAIQALHWTDAKRAWPVFERLLQRDAGIKWPEIKGKGRLAPEAATYGNCAGLIAALSARAGNRDAVPLLCEAIGRTRNPGNQWAILRALGELGDPRAIETVRRYTRRGGGDTSGVAIQAAGRLGDREVLPLIRRALSDPRGYDIRQVYAIEAAAALKADDLTDSLLPFLQDPKNEMMRAAAADALARIGDPDTAALEEESFPWVAGRMRHALTALRARTGASIAAP